MSASSARAVSPRVGARERDAAASRLAQALAPPDLAALPKRRLRAMLVAGLEALECCRVLRKGGLNLVSEVLRGHGTFIEYDHYPENDVYDPDTRSQYYYHAHRGMEGEHGHFHTFLRLPDPGRTRASAMAPGADGGAAEETDPVPLIAISMDPYGWPIGLFATNHWVTGGLWLPAEETIALLPGFRIDHAHPSWPVNRWMSAMFTLFRPHVELLLHHRDAVIAVEARARAIAEVLEDRELEVTGYLPISVEDTVSALRAVLNLQEPTA